MFGHMAGQRTAAQWPCAVLSATLETGHSTGTVLSHQDGVLFMEHGDTLLPSSLIAGEELRAPTLSALLLSTTQAIICAEQRMATIQPSTQTTVILCLSGSPVSYCVYLLLITQWRNGGVYNFLWMKAHCLTLYKQSMMNQSGSTSHFDG